MFHLVMTIFNCELLKEIVFKLSINYPVKWTDVFSFLKMILLIVEI